MSANQLVAKCGLNCAVCPIHAAPIGNRVDWLERAAEHYKWQPADIFCDGCGGDLARRWTDDTCKIIACQRRTGHDYCIGCEEFPCETAALKAPENLRRIREIGIDAWLAEDLQRYTCSACGRLAMNSDKVCFHCGQELKR